MGLTSESSDDTVSMISKMPSKHTIKASPRDKPYKCDFKGCQASFGRPWRLNAHKALHLGKKPFPCTVEGCDKAYTSSYHLKRHLLTSHTETKPVEKIYKCKYEGCQAAFSLRQNELRHYKRTHGTKSCKTCGKVFIKTVALRAHEYYHTGEPPFKCAECKIGFLSITDLSRHTRTHKEHLCPIKNCLELFENWSSLRKHLAKHPHDYNCYYCKKPYRMKEFLIAHIKKHMMDTPVRKQTVLQRYTCHICSASLLGKASMKRHIIRLHQNPTPIKTVKKQRATRKDKGLPKKSMATTLSSIIADAKIENKLLKGESVVSTLDKVIKSTHIFESQEVFKEVTVKTKINAQNKVSSPKGLEIFESQSVIEEMPEYKVPNNNEVSNFEDTLKQIFEPQFVREIPMKQTDLDLPVEVNTETTSVIKFDAIVPKVHEIEYYDTF